LIETFSDWLHDELANELVAVSGTSARSSFARSRMYKAIPKSPAEFPGPAF